MFEFKCSTGKLFGQTGVYRWYYVDNNNVEKTIYVGQSYSGLGSRELFGDHWSAVV